MTRWEYTVLIASTKLISVQMPARSFSEEPGKLSLVLNRLGDDGWELSSTSTSSDDGEFMLLLKRPKPEPPSKLEQFAETYLKPARAGESSHLGNDA